MFRRGIYNTFSRPTRSDTPYCSDRTTLLLVSPHPPLYGAHHHFTSPFPPPSSSSSLILSLPHRSFTKVGACIVCSIPLHPVVILFGEVQLNPVFLGVPGEKAPTLPASVVFEQPTLAGSRSRIASPIPLLGLVVSYRVPFKRRRLHSSRLVPSNS